CAPGIFGAAGALLLLALQLIPFAPQALTYPIWKNAADALGIDLGNTISLDPGATVQSLLHLLFLTSALLAIAGGAIDRNRARVIHRMIAVGVCLLCVVLLGDRQLNAPRSVWSTMLDAIGPIALIIGASLILPRRDDMGKRLIDVAIG